MRVLVTGGCGYIGSNLIHELQNLGFSIVVLDDLSSGSLERLDGIRHTFLRGDVNDSDACLEATKGVDAIFHLAAKKSVSESINLPSLYYRVNTSATNQLIEAASRNKVKTFIFSSSAAVYKNVGNHKVSETSQIGSPSPYGHSKFLAEEIINRAAEIYDISAISLRYFNVAGSLTKTLRDNSEFNLFPSVIKRIKQGNPAIIYGNDYNTTDGTCIRDYVHVKDLIRGHILALDKASREFVVEPINLGNGNGHSVLEIIQKIFLQMGIEESVVFENRRPGDPDFLVADTTKAKRILGWHPELSVEQMVESSIF